MAEEKKMEEDIQWLKKQYTIILDREEKLLKNLIKTIDDFESRLKALEKKLKED